MSQDVHCDNCGSAPCTCPVCFGCGCFLDDDHNESGMCPECITRVPEPKEIKEPEPKQGKFLYQLFPERPPYCPMEDCTCVVYSMDGDEPYKPGRSIFCMGLAKEPVDQEWFGEKHVNDIFQCTWFPRGWERALINMGDIEIQLVLLLKVYQQKNKGQAISPTWLLRKAGWANIANELDETIKLHKIKKGFVWVLIDNEKYQVSTAITGEKLYKRSGKDPARFDLYITGIGDDTFVPKDNTVVTLADSDMLYSTSMHINGG